MPTERCGPAEEAELFEVLRQLASRSAAASLIVSDGISERIFYFSIGGIRVIRSGPRKSASIGEMLREMGKLQESQVEPVLERCRAEKRLFGEIAVAMGFVTRDDVDTSIRLKVEEEILDIFLWDGAEYRLIDGQPPREFYAGRFHAASLSCNVQTFVQSMIQRVESWRGVLGRLPTGRELYRLEPDADLTPFDASEVNLLAMFDGTRMAKDVIADADRRRTPAWDVVLRAVGSGALRRIHGHAAQSVKREQIVREVDALERALPQAVDPRIVRARLARACESIGERSRAAGHWRSLADGHRRRNDLTAALEAYRHAIRLLPTDFSAREIVLDIHRHNRDHSQMVADGRPLADVLIRHNLLNRAKLLLLQLVAIVPDDAPLRRQLILVLIGLGEHELALEHLRRLAATLEARGAEGSELLDVYMRILAMDRRDAQARERIDALTGASAQRRAMRLTIAASLLSFAAVGGAFAYESAARREFAGAFDRAQVHADRQEFDVARSELELVAQRYAFAWVSIGAREEMERLASLSERRAERAKRMATAHGRPLSDAELEAMNTRRRVRETAARAVAARGADLLARGDHEGAHARVRELLNDYADTEAAASAVLPLRISALPSDATVLVDGTPQGKGVAVVRYTPAKARCCASSARASSPRSARSARCSRSILTSRSTGVSSGSTRRVPSTTRRRSSPTSASTSPGAIAT